MRARLFGMFVLALACGDEPAPYFIRDSGPPRDAGTDAGPPGICTFVRGDLTCVGDVAWTCRDGEESDPVDCAARGERCAEHFGCRPCVPGEVRCLGEQREVCNPTGTAWEPRETCDAEAGLRCGVEGCTDLCARAEAERDYVGCEYWPVVTPNRDLLPEHQFAVVVSNPQLVEAKVVIDRGGEEVASGVVAPGAIEVFPLPWIEELRAPSQPSTRLRDGTYRLESDVPVVATQWNPLEFQLDRDCEGEVEARQGDGVCRSYTNDASLLLPTPALTGTYLVSARASMTFRLSGRMSPGFVTIVAVDPRGAQVEVEARAHIVGIRDGSFGAMAPGDRQVVALAHGEVLQLASRSLPECPPGYSACDGGSDHDLTGTLIRSRQPIAVVAGHDCTQVPTTTRACDHLEEQLFPFETLGTSALVAPIGRESDRGTWLRVVSGAEDNELRFEPVVRRPVTLGLGEWIEFELPEAVRVSGTKPIHVTLFRAGSDSERLGDPAMTQVAPEMQFRQDYAFLTPGTFTEDWVQVTAPLTARILLDGRLVQPLIPIRGTSYGYANVLAERGAHRVTANQPFGLQVYGFAAFTSYWFPGGLDLHRITPPI